MAGRIVYLSEVPKFEHVKLFDGQPDMMSVPKVAELLGVNPQTIRREIRKGAIRSAHVGARVLVSKKALLEYLGEISE